MLSRGEVAPESMLRIRKIGIAISANWGIDRTRVASRMPSDVVANR